jgi:pimeloyl-ACP methyl ester carboxylesterase
MPALIRFMEERARFRGRWVGALERTDLPVLIGWGHRDPVTPLAIGERLARNVPGAQLAVWDDVGHFPQLEDPAAVAAAVEAFCARVDGVRATT